MEASAGTVLTLQQIGSFAVAAPGFAVLAAAESGDGTAGALVYLAAALDLRKWSLPQDNHLPPSGHGSAGGVGAADVGNVAGVVEHRAVEHRAAGVASAASALLDADGPLCAVEADAADGEVRPLAAGAEPAAAPFVGDVGIHAASVEKACVVLGQPWIGQVVSEADGFVAIAVEVLGADAA